MSVIATIWDPSSRSWPELVSRLRSTVPETQLFHLLPPQFALAALPGIGGRILDWTQDGKTVAIGYCLPARDADGSAYFLVNYLPVSENSLGNVRQEALKTALNAKLPSETFRFFEVSSAEQWPDPPDLEKIADITYAQPRVQDIHALRQLQSLVWQARPENLYPTFLHHPNCEAAWSLVARKDDKVVGFLLGFWHGLANTTSSSAWAFPQLKGVFESQALGIHPDFRQLSIAFHLKRLQAQELHRRGITHVQWTADPLQYGNASLNFNRLAAAGTALLPDYLPFRNALNRVPASRLRVVWPLDAPLVQKALTHGRASRSVDLIAKSDLQVVNNNLRQVQLGSDAPELAIEIPANWNLLQENDLPQAQAWREVTDGILAQYLGTEAGKYIVTQTGRAEDKRYLIASQVGSSTSNKYGL